MDIKVQRGHESEGGSGSPKRRQEVRGNDRRGNPVKIDKES
ncbi:MAG: hypothetical protein Q7J27_12525 [Syntrophales bacterium]|nr:hypothetical protein [Syntrophales bacterium]